MNLGRTISLKAFCFAIDFHFKARTGPNFVHRLHVLYVHSHAAHGACYCLGLAGGTG